MLHSPARPPFPLVPAESGRFGVLAWKSCLGMHFNPPFPSFDESPWTAPQTHTPAGRPGRGALFIEKIFIVFLLTTNNLSLRDVISLRLAQHALRRVLYACSLCLTIILAMQSLSLVMAHKDAIPKTEDEDEEEAKFHLWMGNVTHKKHSTPLSLPCCQQRHAPSCISSQRTLSFAVLMSKHPSAPSNRARHAPHASCRLAHTHTDAHSLVVHVAILLA